MAEQQSLFELRSGPTERGGPPEPLTTPAAGRGKAACGAAVCAEKSCRRQFQPYRPNQRFCSETCRNRDWTARHPRASEREARAQAKKTRDRSMASAARHYRAETEAARRVALEVLAARGTGIISHVREECDRRGLELDWGANWAGSLFHASPWFEATGRRLTAFHVTSNARKVNEYRLSAAGRAALQGFRR